MTHYTRMLFVNALTNALSCKLDQRTLIKGTDERILCERAGFNDKKK